MNPKVGVVNSRRTLHILVLYCSTLGFSLDTGCRYLVSRHFKVFFAPPPKKQIGYVYNSILWGDYIYVEPNPPTYPGGTYTISCAVASLGARTVDY